MFTPPDRETCEYVGDTKYYTWGGAGQAGVSRSHAPGTHTEIPFQALWAGLFIVHSAQRSACEMLASRNSHFLTGECLLLVTLACWIRSASPQVTVQVRESLGTEDYILLDTYTFPKGFSNPLDWFVTSYANLPPEGTTAILYQPLSEESCSELQPVQFCDEIIPQVNATKYENLTRWALVDGYRTCTQKKINDVRAAGFDGMITFSYNESRSDYKLNRPVLDRTSGMYFDVTSTGFPIVIVSEQFAGVLREIAITADTNATECFTVLVSISSDPVRQSWIMFAVAFSMVIVLVGIPLITCLCVCCCLCDLCVNGCPKCSCKVSCCSACCANRGVYEVNEVHVRVLGDGIVLRQPQLEEEETSFGTRDIAPMERFHRVFENSNEPATRKYHAAVEINMSCAICLECFDEEETVHALSCNEHHVFHPQCIERWLETYNVCPVCRAYVIQPSF